MVAAAKDGWAAPLKADDAADERAIAERTTECFGRRVLQGLQRALVIAAGSKCALSLTELTIQLILAVALFLQ